MSSFTEPLIIRFLGNEYETEREMKYYFEYSDGDFIIIPSGFKTDLISIPRVFWSIFGHPAEYYAQAAVLHDYMIFLCKSQGTYSRKFADQTFKNALEILNVPKWKKIIMYGIVRAFSIYSCGKNC